MLLKNTGRSAVFVQLTGSRIILGPGQIAEVPTKAIVGLPHGVVEVVESVEVTTTTIMCSTEAETTVTEEQEFTTTKKRRAKKTTSEE